MDMGEQVFHVTHQAVDDRKHDYQSVFLVLGTRPGT